MAASRIDAEFFEMIHHLLDEQESTQDLERRSNDRHAYRCIQLVASYDGVTLPNQSEFNPILCQDLSPQGFSFIASGAPQTKFVIIALGAIPFKFFSAKIVRSKPMQDQGETKYLVGCRIVDRFTD